MEYTYKEVIEACKEVKGLLTRSKVKKRKLLDMRNYLMALLYFKYYDREENIGLLFGIDRCSVNHSKQQPYNLIFVKDAFFLENVADLIEKFPFKFPATRVNVRKPGLSLYLDAAIMKRVDKYMLLKELHRRDFAVKELMLRGLDLWEEMMVKGGMKWEE
jgi:hypothetical protein